jgi:predicted ester cyclase
LPAAKCVIEDLVIEEDRAAARMTFSGRRQGRLLGPEPTGRLRQLGGAAFFKTKDGRISDLWALGDLDALKRQLRG